MIYQLDLSLDAKQLRPWIYIFMCLSLKKFELICDKLDFPFYPREDLRQLAHDFALTREIVMQNSEYATAIKAVLSDPVDGVTSIDLLEGVSQDASYSIKCEKLFMNTFSYLEKMGYAEDIYWWGKQTHIFYEFANKRQDVAALHDWCRLLREWAVLEWLRKPVTREHPLYTDGMERVIAKYAPIYTHTPPKSFAPLKLEPLHLSVESHVALQAVILHYEARKLLFETIVDEIKAAPKNIWDDFAFRAGTAGGSWIIFEGYLRIDLREWRMLVDVMRSEDMLALEHWGLKHQDRHRDLKILPANFRVPNSNEGDATTSSK